MGWLTGAEASLIAQDQQPVPDNIPIIEQLLCDHQVNAAESLMSCRLEIIWPHLPSDVALLI